MNDKPQMLMFVYNDLTTDARVQRSLDTLKQAFDITILSTGDPYERDGIKNVVLNSSKTGMRKYFDISRQVISYGKKHQFEYLYLHDYYSCIPGLRLYKKHKTIYDAHELIIGTKQFPAPKREKFFGFFEKLIVDRVQLIISADAKRAEMMRNFYKLNEIPYVVPNYSELPIDEEYSFTPDLIEFFKDKRKTLVYAGALTGGRNIEKIILSAAQLTGEYKVLIVGDGGEKSKLEKIASECNGLKYLFTGSVPYKHLGSILRRCDVGYLSYPMTNLNNIYCAPNKIYEYASVELPMICNDNTNLISIVGASRIGVCVSEKGKEGCSRSIEEALELLHQDYDTYKKNIQTFRKENSWAIISEKYLSKVQSI